MQDQIEELLTERRFDIAIAPQLEAYADEQVRFFFLPHHRVNWLDFLSFFRIVTWRIWQSDGKRELVRPECTVQCAAGRMWRMRRIRERC